MGRNAKLVVILVGCLLLAKSQEVAPVITLASAPALCLALALALALIAGILKGNS